MGIPVVLPSTNTHDPSSEMVRTRSGSALQSAPLDASAVQYGIVRGVLRTDRAVEAAFVGRQLGFLGDVRADDLRDLITNKAIGGHRTGRAGRAIDKGDDAQLVGAGLSARRDGGRRHVRRYG